MSGKKSGKVILFLSLIITFICSCEFEPHKVYERTVNEDVSAPGIQVVELNLNYDTLYLYAQKEIKFRFVSSDQKIPAVRFTIDNVEQYLVNSTSGVFNLDYRIFTNGIHALVLEVYAEKGNSFYSSGK